MWLKLHYILQIVKITLYQGFKVRGTLILTMNFDSGLWVIQVLLLCIYQFQYIGLSLSVSSKLFKLEKSYEKSTIGT